LGNWEGTLGKCEGGGKIGKEMDEMGERKLNWILDRPSMKIMWSER
jgi:hypothetical protein